MADLKRFVAENPERVERIIARIEIVGLVLTLLAVFLMTKKISAGDTLLIMGLSTLSFVYFLLANIAPQLFKLQPGKLFTIVLQVSYGALAFTMMGILFILQRWPHGSLMMNIGCVVTGGMFLYLTYKMYFGNFEDEGHRVIINNLIVRMLPALVAAAFLIAVYFR